MRCPLSLSRVQAARWPRLAAAAGGVAEPHAHQRTHARIHTHLIATATSAPTKWLEHAAPGAPSGRPRCSSFFMKGKGSKGSVATTLPS